MMTYKKLVDYKWIDKNVIGVSGTNEFFDLMITLNFRKSKHGNHTGMEKAGKWLWQEVKPLVSKAMPIRFITHSMGALAIFAAMESIKDGYVVSDKSEYMGFINCCNKKMMQIPGVALICGNDPIPGLFRKKYGFPVTHVWFGDTRTPKGIRKQILPFVTGKGDHQGYDNWRQKIETDN